MCVLTIPTNFTWNILNSKKISERCHNCTYVFLSNARFPAEILVEVQFAPQIFEEYSYVKRYENPSSGSRVV